MYPPQSDHGIAVSGGLDMVVWGSNWSDRSTRNISGITRIKRTIYLISENLFFPGDEFTRIISGGIRWATEKVAVDFASFRPLAAAESFIGVPRLEVTIPFGRK